LDLPVPANILKDGRATTAYYDEVRKILFNYVRDPDVLEKLTAILTKLESEVAVSVDDAMIVIPTDAQGVKRTKHVETTTNLAANATYTGATIYTSTERRIVGIVSANQAGSLYVESSTDGTNWYSVFKQDIAANTPFGFDVPCYTEYTRIKYTNGNTAQTAFRLAAYTLPI